MNLKNLLSKVKEEWKEKYNYDPVDFNENSLQESYILLSELLNPSNAYPYKQIGLGIWVYNDSNENEIYVRLVYQPVKDGYLEFKTWWIDENGNKIYNEVPQGSNTQDWDKRTDTIAKIFMDEVIPKFKENSLTDYLVFVPVTKSRYLFSLRMIKKFIPNDWEIIEQFPTKITIRKI